MTEDERNRRKEFNRKLFVLQAQLLGLQEQFAKIGKTQCELWILNDEILEEKNGE